MRALGGRRIEQKKKMEISKANANQLISHSTTMLPDRRYTYTFCMFQFGLFLPVQRARHQISRSCYWLLCLLSSEFWFADCQHTRVWQCFSIGCTWTPSECLAFWMDSTELQPIAAPCFRVHEIYFFEPINSAGHSSHIDFLLKMLVNCGETPSRGKISSDLFISLVDADVRRYLSFSCIKYEHYIGAHTTGRTGSSSGS